MIKLAYFTRVAFVSERSGFAGKNHIPDLGYLRERDTAVFFLLQDRRPFVERQLYEARVCQWCKGDACVGDAKEANRCNDGIQVNTKHELHESTLVKRRVHAIYLRSYSMGDPNCHLDAILEITTPSQLALRELRGT
jgi:hypothetical protein